jgi:hypothetical protein
VGYMNICDEIMDYINRYPDSNKELRKLLIECKRRILDLERNVEYNKMKEKKIKNVIRRVQRDRRTERNINNKE